LWKTQMRPKKSSMPFKRRSGGRSSKRKKEEEV
jgi:hypothetical protein